jgi:hypothetical protein
LAVQLAPRRVGPPQRVAQPPLTIVQAASERPSRASHSVPSPAARIRVIAKLQVWRLRLLVKLRERGV